MKTACILARGRGHQLFWGNAFAAGLRRHGWRVVVGDQQHPCDLLVLWGVRNQAAIELQKGRGGDVCVLERGYIGDRFTWTSVSFGGRLNGRAEFRGVRTDPERFERHFAGLMRPWQARPGYALLIGQVPGDMSIAHVGIDAWYRDTAARLKTSGFDVRFRPHPMAIRRRLWNAPIPGVPWADGDLQAALAGASVAVTFSSNAGVDAAMAGIPVIAMDLGSMAWPVASHSVEEPLKMPDRAEWASALSWKQFAPVEIASGECWETVSAPLRAAS